MTPPPTARAQNSENNNSTGQYRVVRKRNRVPLSCAPCRNRKLKCNRSQPCENCVRRGDATSCFYAAPGSRKKNGGSSSTPSSPDDMQNRIDRLEGLVLSLMTNGAESAGPSAASRALSQSTSSDSPDFLSHQSSRGDGDDDEMNKDDEMSETEEVAKSLGVLKVMDNKSFYIGDTHWAAILNDISEVRNYFQEHKKQYNDQAVKIEAIKANNGFAQGPAFIFGGRSVPKHSDLLAAIPRKEAMDKIVARYFNDYDPAIHVLHPPSWRRTYEKHWQDPAKTDPAWLGQLFAICCLTMHSYHRSGDEPFEYNGRSMDLAAEYRSLTAQSLLLADFTKPLNHMVETMILHLQCEYARTREAEVGVWVMIGMVVRLAMRMGYHRDPKYYPNLTPFQGEMRRRCWTFVRHSDLLFSFQMSLPSMMRLDDCDTELPRNMYDEEFDEDTINLPPSRAKSSPTPVSYMIAKAEIALSFGKIIECLHIVKPAPYDEIMSLDRDLHQTYNQLAPHLQMRSIEESMLDPVSSIMQRFNLAILYHKGLCVLHRRYVSQSRENARYDMSRRTCIDSSLELLRYQEILHNESRPGRRLHCMKWYISSLTSHDFLLAATLVSLDMWYTARADILGHSHSPGSRSSSTSAESFQWDERRRDEMMRSIEVSREIWTELRDQSMEAFKASEMLTVMLKTIRTMRSQANSLAQSFQRTTSIWDYNDRINEQMIDSAKRSNGAPGANNKGNGPGVTNMTSPSLYATPPDFSEKPEHSAALTLGLLSAGGMTPGNTPGQGFNAGPGFPMSPGGTNAELPPRGMTPNFPLDPAFGGADYGAAASPFSILTKGAGGGDGMGLDWDAWDSYIQNVSLDASVDIWNGGGAGASPGMDFTVLNSGQMEGTENDRNM